MGIESRTLDLFGHSFTLPPSKVATNAVRIPFVTSAHEWASKLDAHFLGLFETLDQLYSQADSLANEVRLKSINDAMTALSEFGIYDLTEDDFYTRFMAPYDGWADAFDTIATQYEAVVERTAELDAHRTARRQNRRMWIGYGSEEAVYYADGKNVTSNIAHGVFNLVAKGVTTLGNSIKKDEILRNPATKQQVIDGVCGLVTAANLGLVDAINTEAPESVHQYSDEEISKVEAIIANLQRNRIPSNDVLRTLVRGIQIFPYNIDVYTLLLDRFGSDEGRLNSVVEYFGIIGWRDELHSRFEEKRRKVSLVTVQDCQTNLPDLEKFAATIGYAAFAEEAPCIRQTAARSAFDQKVNSTNLLTRAACDEYAEAFEVYSNEIGFSHFTDSWTSVVARAIENDFLTEAAKHLVATTEECERELPSLQSFAGNIGYAGFDTWAARVRADALAKDQAILAAARLRARKTRRWMIWLLLIGLAVGWVFYRHAQVQAIQEQRRAADEVSAQQEQAQQSPPSPQVTSEQDKKLDMPEEHSSLGVAGTPTAPAAAVQHAASDAALTAPATAAQTVAPDSALAASAASQIAEPDNSLPFVGEMTFSFSGGNATEERIKIERDGQTTIQICSENCSVTYQGPYRNPMWSTESHLKGYGWMIRGDEIIQLRNGSVVRECGDEGQSPCVSKLDPIPNQTPTARQTESPNPQYIAAEQEKEWNKIKMQIDPMVNSSIYARRCVGRLVATAMRYGMSQEEASQGVSDRCDQLVADAQECAGIGPGRPRRCTESIAEPSRR